MTAKKPAKSYPPESEWASGTMVADGVQYRGPKQFRASIWSLKPPLQETFETLEAAVSWRDTTLKKVKGEGPDPFADTKLGRWPEHSVATRVLTVVEQLMGSAR